MSLIKYIYIFFIINIILQGHVESFLLYYDKRGGGGTFYLALRYYWKHNMTDMHH